MPDRASYERLAQLFDDYVQARHLLTVESHRVNVMFNGMCAAVAAEQIRDMGLDERQLHVWFWVSVLVTSLYRFDDRLCESCQFSQRVSTGLVCRHPRVGRQFCERACFFWRQVAQGGGR